MHSLLDTLKQISQQISIRTLPTYDFFNLIYLTDDSWSPWRQWRYLGFSFYSLATERSGWHTSGISCFLFSICPQVVTMKAHIRHLCIRTDICTHYNAIEKSMTMNLHTVKQGSCLHTQLFPVNYKNHQLVWWKDRNRGGRLWILEGRQIRNYIKRNNH